ncbi:LysR family transcriptional regulator [Ottowia thiooxydans]|uniref:LysR family transcriptional regulator n=1 Tax=Ottowia thiooxydans TaxID=219182 RepID=UPI0004903808|nr:LysR family transcriptional regulator [Ottowia thiooxydans]
MTLQQLKAFVEVLDHGSFRRASAQLGVSQAGLTGSLQALESGLGVQLIERSTRGLRLTPHGEKLLPRARMILREAAIAESELRVSSDNIDGPLYVGLGPTPTAVFLPLVAPHFHRALPSVRLHLRIGFHQQLQPALQRSEIEIAITAVPDQGVAPGLIMRHLFDSQLQVVCRNEHPLAEATSLKELTSAEWILLGPPGGPGSSIMRVYDENELAAPAVAATCESFTQLAALVGSTDWLALAPSRLVEKGLLGSNIRAMDIQERFHGSSNALIYRADLPLSRPASAFAAMCESMSRVLMRD